MEKLLQELLEKMDELKLNQEKILAHLEESIVLPKFPKHSTPTEKRKNKKQEEKERQDELVAVLKHGSRIRDKYNLAATPQSHRIIHYLRTGNPAAFDGLKRKST